MENNQDVRLLDLERVGEYLEACGYKIVTGSEISPNVFENNLCIGVFCPKTFFEFKKCSIKAKKINIFLGVVDFSINKIWKFSMYGNGRVGLVNKMTQRLTRKFRKSLRFQGVIRKSTSVEGLLPNTNF